MLSIDGLDIIYTNIFILWNDAENNFYYKY